MGQELVEFRPQIYTFLPTDTTEARLVELWLHDLAITTQEGYHIDIQAFFAFVQKPLRAVNLEDLQQFADSLKARGYKETTIARRLRAVKSLFTFGSKTQYLAFNVGAAMKVPKVRRRLHERILTREQVLQMFVYEKNTRNRLFGGVDFSLQ